MTGGSHLVSTTCPPDCGLCCETITLNRQAIDSIFGPTFEARADDPRWDEPSVGGPDQDLPNPRGCSWRHDAAFIREHFHLIGQVRLAEKTPTFKADDPSTALAFRCDAFDPVARACTAYADRPLMCESYPFYGRDPQRLGGRDPINDLTCAFQGDVGPRKVLPLTVIRSSS